jgi:hypothetical protein
MCGIVLSIVLLSCGNKEGKLKVEAADSTNEILDDKKQVLIDTLDTNEGEWQFQQPPDIAFQGFDDVDKNVMLELETDSYKVAPENLEITISNNSDWDISTNTEFEISQYVTDDWEEFDMNKIVLKKKPVTIKKGDKDKLFLKLFKDQFDYPIGRYRVVVFFEFEWARFEHEVRFSIVE